MRPALKSRQSGATAVEFALVLLIFLTFLLAITDFSRMLYTWNAANEATRAGARYAAVCDNTGNEAEVLARMQALLPQISNINIDVVWEDVDGVINSCSPATCAGVTVTIVGLNYQWISPILAFIAPIPMPTFSTYLTREIMRMDPNSETICS